MSQEALAGRLWYVRRRGQVLGPFSVTELYKLRDRGNLAAFDEVSEDTGSAKNWIRFERLVELLEPKPADEPTADAGFTVVQGGYPAPAGLGTRTTSLGLSLIWIGLLLEMLAGLCFVSSGIVLYAGGKFVVFSVLALLWAGLTLAFEIVMAIGYGFAGGAPEGGSKALPVTGLVLQIVDSLLVLVLLILWIISGGVIWAVDRPDPAMQIATQLLLGARVVLWVPMNFVLIEWLKGLADRLERTGGARPGFGRSVGSQTVYHYVLYVLQNVILLFGLLIFMLQDHPFIVMLHGGDKMALTMFIVITTYVMLATVVGIWRIVLAFLTWRAAARG